MRLNKFIALASGLSRRRADTLITEGRVTVNSQPAVTGLQVQPTDSVQIDNGPALRLPDAPKLIMLNKPVGYVCSRNGQGSRTIYNLLPPELHTLKPVGRLDKDSSGLLLLTNDGQLAHELTHPRYHKTKLYQITLDKPLTPQDQRLITNRGIQLSDGLSRLTLTPQNSPRHWQVTMHEGRNRQIRRTFVMLGYRVTDLHRTQFGPYSLGSLPSGKHTSLES